MIQTIGIATSEAEGTPAVFSLPRYGYQAVSASLLPPLAGLQARGIHAPLDIWHAESAQPIVFQLYGPDAQSPLDLSAPGTMVSWLLTDFFGNVAASLSIGAGIGFSDDPSGGVVVVTVPAGLADGIYWDRLTVTLAGMAQTISVGKIRIHSAFILLDDIGVAGLPPIDLTADDE